MAKIIHTLLDKNKDYLAMKEDLKILNRSFVKVGFPEGKPVGVQNKTRHTIHESGHTIRYSGIKGTAHDAYKDMSEVARIAVWNEFGVPHISVKGEKANAGGIPARPFMRNAFDGNRERISNMSAKFADLALTTKITVDQALENLGLFMQDLIRNSIRRGTWAANTKETQRRKGSTKPLIDTGQMINSVTFVKVSGK